MNEENNTRPESYEHFFTRSLHHGRRWKTAGMAAAVVAVLSIAGISFAQSGMHGPHGHGTHEKMDPESMARHFDEVLNRVLPDGTADQKAQVGAIIKGTMADLHAWHAQHDAAHKQVIALLTQPAIDRLAIEQLRAEQMRLVDQLSRRVTQAMADAAEILTPEQRLRLAEHLRKKMG